MVRTLDKPPTLQEVRLVLGQNGKKAGDNFVFQCPICRDKGENNLVLKKNGANIKCFSCSDNEGGKYVLKKINEYRAEHQANSHKVTKLRFLNEKLQEKYCEYMVIANDYLLEHEDLQKLLYEKRGIDKETIKNCCIGFDDTEEHWVLPIFSLTYDCIMGFEYRRKNFDLYPNGSKVRREKGFISDVCCVWGGKTNDTLFLMEGFWDSYCMRQYLRNRGITKGYTIYSCSNGVGSYLNVLNRVDFSGFKKVKLILDADNAGTENTEKIIEQYPFIKDCRQFLFDSDVKDMNAWLLKKGA